MVFGVGDVSGPGSTGTGGTPGLFNDLTTKFADMGAYGKLKTIGAAADGFSSLAQIYAGFKAMELNKKQFKFQKDAYRQDYNANVKDYDNQLKDRWAARAASNAARGRSFESMDSYVGDRKLAESSI